MSSSAGTRNPVSATRPRPWRTRNRLPPTGAQIRPFLLLPVAVCPQYGDGVVIERDKPLAFLALRRAFLGLLPELDDVTAHLDEPVIQSTSVQRNATSSPRRRPRYAVRELARGVLVAWQLDRTAA